MNGNNVVGIGNGLLMICVAACWLTLIVQTFKRGETGMGLVCLLLCCCGVVVGLGYGWSKANEWNNVMLMLAYTASCGMLLLSVLISTAMMLSEWPG